MDKLCLLRSMTHRMNVHGPACSEIFTGRPYFGPPITDQASREDWPSLVVAGHALRPAARRAAAVGRAAVVLCSSPGRTSGSPGRPAGGWASGTTPFLVHGDLGSTDFELAGLSTCRTTCRLTGSASRRTLLDRLETARPSAARRRGARRRPPGRVRPARQPRRRRLRPAPRAGRGPRPLRPDDGRPEPAAGAAAGRGGRLAGHGQLAGRDEDRRRRTPAGTRTRTTSPS